MTLTKGSLQFHIPFVNTVDVQMYIFMVILLEGWELQVDVFINVNFNLLSRVWYSISVTQYHNTRILFSIFVGDQCQAVKSVSIDCKQSSTIPIDVTSFEIKKLGLV